MRLPFGATVTSPDKRRVRKTQRRYADGRTKEAGQGGAALDITTTEDGGLLLQKHLPACNICGGTQGVVKFKGFDICRECRQGLREVAGDD